eukprot:4046815-Amphidinium_carterae.1
MPALSVPPCLESCLAKLYSVKQHDAFRSMRKCSLFLIEVAVANEVGVEGVRLCACAFADAMEEEDEDEDEDDEELNICTALCCAIQDTLE